MSRTLKARSYASRNSLSLRTPPKGSPTSTERWCVLFLSSYCARSRSADLDALPPLLVAAHFSQASGPSRELYGSFLKRMGELYKPDRIQGAQPFRARTGACTARHATRYRSSYFRLDYVAELVFGVNRRTVRCDDGCPPDKRGKGITIGRHGRCFRLR